MTAQELEPYLREYNSLGDQSKALLLLAANRISALPHSKIVEMANKLHPKVDPSRIDFRHSSFREIALCLLAVTETKASHETADTLGRRAPARSQAERDLALDCGHGLVSSRSGQIFSGQESGKTCDRNSENALRW